MRRRSSLTSLFVLLALASPAAAQETTEIVEGNAFEVSSLTATTTDGEAKIGQDYEPFDSATNEVRTIDDDRVEDPETFTVTEGLLGEKTTVVTILDNDAPKLSLGGASVGEGDGSAVLPVTLEAPAERPVEVTASIVPGTAGAGDAGAPQRVTIPAGQQSASLTVPITGDDEDEPDETFTVSLAGGPSATVTIRNDDLRSLAVGDALVLEGDGGDTVVRVPVTLSAPTFRTVTARYSTVDGTAGAPGDFLARLGTLNIAPGQTSAAIEIPVVGDDRREDDESFVVRLSRELEATTFRGAGTVVVRDDDTDLQPATAAAARDLLAPALVIGRPRLSGRTISVRVSCPETERFCTGRLTLATAADRRAKARSLRRARRLAQRTYTVSGGEARTLKVRLSTRVLAAARRSGRLRLRASTRTTDAAGNAATGRSAATLRVKRSR